MKWYHFGIILLILVVLRQGVGDVIFHLTDLGVIANWGSLVAASFLAGWLAGAIVERGVSYGELLVLAALGVIAEVGIGFAKGVSHLVLALVFRFIIYTPVSYGCLVLGAALAERGSADPPSPSEASVGTD
jgi:hypothetical protein